MKSISVFCASSEGNDKAIVETAYNLGRSIAQSGMTLVYGGSKIGLMGIVANASLKNNGKVIGVIPDFLTHKEIRHDGLTELIVVKNMHERKLKMHELSDGLIALPGGFGTLEELFEMVTWGQLGLHNKPMGILNANGYYNELLAFMDTMVAKGLLKQQNRDLILVDDTCEGLLQKMQAYQPTYTPKWINKEQT